MPSVCSEHGFFSNLASCQHYSQRQDSDISQLCASIGWTHCRPRGSAWASFKLMQESAQPTESYTICFAQSHQLLRMKQLPTAATPLCVTLLLPCNSAPCFPHAPSYLPPTVSLAQPFCFRAMVRAAQGSSVAMLIHSFTSHCQSSWFQSRPGEGRSHSS